MISLYDEISYFNAEYLKKKNKKTIYHSGATTWIDKCKCKIPNSTELILTFSSAVAEISEKITLSYGDQPCTAHPINTRGE